MLADIRYALRLIRKTPVFTASVVLTIALAIGATTAIFSVVNAVLLQPLPFAEPRRLYQVAEKNDKLHVPVFAASVLNFLSWREQVERFDEMGAVGGVWFTHGVELARYALGDAAGVGTDGRPRTAEPERAS